MADIAIKPLYSCEGDTPFHPIPPMNNFSASGVVESLYTTWPTAMSQKAQNHTSLSTFAYSSVFVINSAKYVPFQYSEPVLTPTKNVAKPELHTAFAAT